ncbi:MAG: hypothetical protein KBS55_04055 [Bacteroidales bacterium]|nr:hypothetical protein [Candidatus Cryptobacteroides aphodequi]
MSECAAAQARRDSLRLEAVRFERAAFEAYDPMEVSLALVSKAEVLREAGLPEQAEEALGRVRMYALDDAQRRDVLVLKALCAYDRADYEAALVALNQAGGGSVVQ